MHLMKMTIVAILLLLAPQRSDAKASPKCSMPILAMTYNIRLDTPVDGANGWQYRKDFLIGQILTLRPDILGMQEVLPNQRDDLARALPDHVLIGGGRDDGNRTGEASPLAIDKRRFQILSHGMFWLSPTPDQPSLGWDGGYKRVVTWARLKAANGISVLTINTHWDHQGVIARQESGRLVLEWLSTHRRKGEKLLLLGDFNAATDEASLAQLLRPDRLQDTRLVSRSTSFGGDTSFNAFDAFPKSGKRIDHIFVGPGVGVRAHGILAQHQNGQVASDHFPVVALLDFGSCN